MQQRGFPKKGENAPSRAVPAIEIDTELANRQYENQAELEQLDQHPTTENDFGTDYSN
jgi:hypothetical protein